MFRKRVLLHRWEVSIFLQQMDMETEPRNGVWKPEPRNGICAELSSNAISAAAVFAAIVSQPGLSPVLSELWVRRRTSVLSTATMVPRNADDGSDWSAGTGRFCPCYAWLAVPGICSRDRHAVNDDNRRQQPDVRVRPASGHPGQISPMPPVEPNNLEYNVVLDRLQDLKGNEGSDVIK